MIVDDALSGLSGELDGLYSHRGRPSIPPEGLLRVLLQASLEHFTVDGTLVEAWASLKSFRPKDDRTIRPLAAATPAGSSMASGGPTPAIPRPPIRTRGCSERPWLNMMIGVDTMETHG